MIIRDKDQKTWNKWRQKVLLSLLVTSAFSLVPLFCFSQSTYRIEYRLADKDTGLVTQSLGLQTVFSDQTDASVYVSKLTSLLVSKGFATASIDSISYGNTSAFILMYLGKKYRVGNVSVDSVDKKVLEESGWFKRRLNGNYYDLQTQQQQVLQYYERSGYPFAAVSLDSVRINGDEITGKLKVNKGPLYHIDSIRNYGRVRIKKYFLEKYLSIPGGSLYNKQRLDNISRRLRELPYLQEERPWDITMLGTGATINLYLIPKRSSQVNFLVGFLPGSGIERKLQLTGDVNLNLKNALGAGETILINWQQLQPKSPRLNLGYTHPYIFKSLFGIDFNFDLLKRDSSYLQINGQLGVQYVLSENQSGKVFIQNYRSYLLPGAFDTNVIRQTKQLPQDIDMNAISLGVDYDFNNTDYRFNPRKGNELRVIVSAGTKTISMNNDILNLRDPLNPNFKFRSLYDSIKLKSYQFRSNVVFAHFFPVAKRSALKAGLNAGYLSSQQLFRNELFQLGGYKLLRGFSEQSVFADRYAVITAEYRNLFETNSYFFLFTDIGFSRTKFQSTNFSNNFLGTGLGLNFETKFGLLNLSYAIGKRNDVKFDLRQSSKIHFGYINYF